MSVFQSDPVGELEPIGGSAVGVWLPALMLVASIAVSWYLYWYFNRKRQSGQGP